MKKIKTIAIIILTAIITMGAKKVPELKYLGLLTSTPGQVSFIYSLNALDNMYMRFINKDEASTGMVWDTSLNGGEGGLGVPSAVTWSNSDVTPTTDTRLTVGGWNDSPPSNIPDGTYDQLYYNNATPASSDTVEFGRQVQIRSGKIQSKDDL